jgi:hypothetical protein
MKPRRGKGSFACSPIGHLSDTTGVAPISLICVVVRGQLPSLVVTSNGGSARDLPLAGRPRSAIAPGATSSAPRMSATAFLAVESKIRAPHGRILSARARQSRTHLKAESGGAAMLGCMLVREATAVDWAAIWTILKEVGAAGETLTWDPKTTEARARADWMRDLPGRTIVAVDDDGNVVGSANTHPTTRGRGHMSSTPDSLSTRPGAARA